MLGKSLQVPMVSIKSFFRFVARPVTGRGSSYHGIVGQTLRGRYKILRKLGQGGLGQTYLAEDLQMMIVPRPQRVMKQILPEQMNTGARRYFRKEAHALSSLKHSQIPVLYDFFEVEGIPYIVQDFIEGHDLTAEIGHYADVETVDRARCWTEQDVIIFLMDMLGILDYIHTQNIIHRDIKPSNIMRRQSDDVLVLIDFGIVKNTDDSGGSSRSIAFGTKGYMPLEQGLSNAQFNSDVYALGMTAIQAIVGIPPYYLSIEQRLSLLGGAVSPALFTIIRHLVDEDYKERCQSAKIALSLLQPLVLKERSNYRSPSRFASQSTLKPTNPPVSTVKASKPKKNLRASLDDYIRDTIANLYAFAIFVSPPALILFILSPLVFPRSTLLYDVMLYMPDNYSLYYDRGLRKQYTLNDYQGALADYNKVIEIDPKYALAYNARGVLKHDKLNDPRGALADYKKAIELDPKLAQAYYHSAVLKQYKLGDPQGALVNYNKAIELDPKYAEFYSNRGILKEYKFSDLKGALDDYNKAIELDPQYAWAYYARGLLKKDKSKNAQDAIADFRQAAKLYRQQGQAKDLQKALDRLKELGASE